MLDEPSSSEDEADIERIDFDNSLPTTHSVSSLLNFFSSVLLSMICFIGTCRYHIIAFRSFYCLSMVLQPKIFFFSSCL